MILFPPWRVRLRVNAGRSQGSQVVQESSILFGGRHRKTQAGRQGETPERRDSGKADGHGGRLTAAGVSDDVTTKSIRHGANTSDGIVEEGKNIGVRASAAIPGDSRARR